MRLGTMARGTALLGWLALAGPATLAAEYPTPLAVEPTNTLTTLPANYPASWIFVHDLNFQSMIDGRAAIIDVAAPSHALKGQFGIAHFGNMLVSKTQPEIYVAETFYSRLTRGERTDTITIWDKVSLAPKGEIILPGGKRGQSVTVKNSFQFTNDEKWAMIFNFTPAASVTIIDLAARKPISTIDIPGCSMIYPTGTRGFSTLCADGTLMGITLNEKGEVARSATSKVLNDTQNDPMFMMPAMVGRTGWFVTFQGTIHGIDFSGDTARDLGTFSLPRTKTEKGEWRPGGWQVVAADPAGQVYVLMSPDGKEGSHKDGGTEVWVADVKAKKRVARIALREAAWSIEVTAEQKPSLIAAKFDGSLDVYDAASGTFLRTVAHAGNSPMTMTAIK